MKCPSCPPTPSFMARFFVICSHETCEVIQDAERVLVSSVS